MYKFTAQSQAFTITVNGLVPLTRHFVYFERRRQSDSICAPVGGAVGQPLVTNSSGTLRFVYYYNAGLSETNSFEAMQNMFNSLVGVKVIDVVSVDQTSLDDAAIRGAISCAHTFITINALQEEQVTNYIFQPAPPLPYPDYNWNPGL